MMLLGVGGRSLRALSPHQIEHAVLNLKVPHVIVPGHSHCGGIAAYRNRRPELETQDGFIREWISILDGAVALPQISDIELDDQTRHELAGIRLSLRNPRVFQARAEREAVGRLALHGADRHIATAALSLLGEAEDRLATLDRDLVA